ncbi:alpha/beta hydrolase [Candidatus Woesebacteria bacterium]|nr:alpha/beta hydrolase [Candidatus Woesebacteria bacterium]
MDLIKTKSFQLATISRGDVHADKLAIMLPGRLDTKDYASCVSHIEYLAGKGYFAVSFDPPGTWDSPGGIELFTTTNYIKAVTELMDHYGNKPTLLIGHSRGGATAILAGATHPFVTSIVAIMASYGAPSLPKPESLKTGVQIEYRDLPPGLQETPEQKWFALPLNYFKDGKQYNVVRSLQTCTKPKLLVYGTRDKFTKPERVKEVFKLIPEPKMLLEVNSDHDHRYHPEVIDEVNGAIGEFLLKYSI